MSVESIGDGIKTIIDAISDLRVFAPKELPESVPETPCAMILPPSIEYNTDFGGSLEMEFRILLFVGGSEQAEKLNTLIDYMEESGTYSILAKIDADKTLNSTASTCILESSSGAGVIEWGGTLYIGTEFILKVWK